MKLVAFLLCCHHCLLHSLAFAASAEQRLYDHLFNNYNPAVRPGSPGTPVVVSVRMLIDSVVDVRWNDSSLCWNPADYENASYLVTPAEKVWRPDLLFETAFENQQFAVKDLVIKINQTCTITFAIGGISTHTCNLDVTLFPFDKQSCSFKVGLCFSRADKIMLLNGTLMHSDNQNEVWDVIATTSSVDKRNSQVTFVLTMKRKPLYYVTYIIIPLIMMAAINVMVFRLPAHSGEKLSLSITVLLAFYVLLLTIKDILPVSSSSTPLLTIYTVSLIFISTLSTIATVFIVRIHHCKNYPLPSRIVKLLRIGKPQTRGGNGPGPGQEWSFSEPSPSQEQPSVPSPQPLAAWSDVATAVDKLSFYLFLVLECILTLGIGVYYAILLHARSE